MVEGLDDEHINDLYDDEEEEQSMGEYKSYAEKQNDALAENKWKQFLALCKNDSVAAVPKGQRLALEKVEQAGSNKALPADIQEVVTADMPELVRLVSSIKNSALGMRVKIAGIIDQIRASDAKLSDSISLINLRVEVLMEYWSYLCLLAIARVDSVILPSLTERRLKTAQ